jgi:hypothetical protein
MPIDLKYGQVSLERGTVARDEPVVVFRAQDRTLPHLLAIYRHLCEVAGSPEHHLANVDANVEAVRAWQADHYTQTPRSEAGSVTGQPGSPRG